MYGSLQDTRNGKIYKTVQIGEQWWMAENLDWTTDSSISNGHFSAEHREKYGRLYQWADAVRRPEKSCGYGYTCSLPAGNIQGVCPVGSHLPGELEWKILIEAVGGESIAGKVLCADIDWEEESGCTDEFGFSALPGGIGLKYRTARLYQGLAARFWSSREMAGTFSAVSVGIWGGGPSMGIGSAMKYERRSVRCILDEPPSSSSESSSSSSDLD